MDMKQNYFKGKSSDNTKFTPYLISVIKKILYHYLDNIICKYINF